ncbi:MAG: hypothetical protein PHD76_02310 [Methylacidiphilales bacterium]|nr:hypothetical protein [Candidatus Methylacidiphilales bacterium]
MKSFYKLFGAICACVLCEACCLAYDPLSVANPDAVRIQDFTVQDKARNREIPIRVYCPVDKTPAPVVLFSHGLGGSREGSTFLGRHWAGRGYMAVFMQHPGSDTSVWQGKPLLERMGAMKEAANGRNFILRTEDVPAVINQLELWNKTSGHPLSGRLDMAKLGMSGHSFGAVTTQAVSGQSFAMLGPRYTDSRIKAAIAFSPSAPPVGDPRMAFGRVKIPWMLMTGTKDLAPIGGATMETRRAVYSALPPGGKYELVLYNAEHSVFTDRALPGDHEPRNPNHHRVILALSTAFWDVWLRGDAEAKAWLESAGPASVLESNDHWQYK